MVGGGRRGAVRGLRGRGVQGLLVDHLLLVHRLLYDLLLVDGLLYDLLLVHGHLHRLGHGHGVGDLHRHRHLHVLLAHLLDHLSALLVVGVVLDNFVLSFTFLLKRLDALFLGNVDGCLVALSLDASPEKSVSSIMVI